MATARKSHRSEPSYRVKIVTRDDGCQRFQPQRKVLWWWVPLKEFTGIWTTELGPQMSVVSLMTMQHALDAIEEDFYFRVKRKLAKKTKPTYEYVHMEEK
jgi:hypothetical protein